MSASFIHPGLRRGCVNSLYVSGHLNHSKKKSVSKHPVPSRELVSVLLVFFSVFLFKLTFSVPVCLPSLCVSLCPCPSVPLCPSLSLSLSVCFLSLSCFLNVQCLSLSVCLSLYFSVSLFQPLYSTLFPSLPPPFPLSSFFQFFSLPLFFLLSCSS